MALAVVLVLLLDLLHLGLERAQRVHRLDLLDRQRQDREPHDHRQRHDRQAPAEPDVVVQERQSSQSATSIRGWRMFAKDHGAPRKRCCALTGSYPPWLNGLQRSRRQTASTSRAAARTRGPPRPRRPSRSARTCSGAGAAARSTAGRGGSALSEHARQHRASRLAGSPLALRRRQPSRSSSSASSRRTRRAPRRPPVAAHRPRHDHEVVARPAARLRAPRKPRGAAA